MTNITTFNFFSSHLQTPQILHQTHSGHHFPTSFDLLPIIKKFSFPQFWLHFPIFLTCLYYYSYLHILNHLPKHTRKHLNNMWKLCRNIDFRIDWTTWTLPSQVDLPDHGYSRFQQIPFKRIYIN